MKPLLLSPLILAQLLLLLNNSQVNSLPIEPFENSNQNNVDKLDDLESPERYQQSGPENTHSHTMDPNNEDALYTNLTQLRLAEFSDTTSNNKNEFIPPLDHHECSDIVKFADKCNFVKLHCKEEHLGYFNYLQIYYCSRSWSLSFFIVVCMCLWLCTLFMAIGIAASDYLCPNLNTISKMLGLSESLAGVTFLAFGNGSPDVFSTYAAMKIGSGSLAIGELIGAASFITAVVAGSMAIIRPFKVARRSFTRDILFFTVAVCFSMYFLSDGVLKRWECLAMLAIYVVYVVFVVGWHWYKTTSRKKYLEENAARNFYTEAGFETRIEQDEEINDEPSVLSQGLDYTGFYSPVEERSFLGPSRSSTNLSLRPNSPRPPNSSRNSITGLPLSPNPAWQEDNEDEQEEAYGELTRGMRLRPHHNTHLPVASGSSAITSGSSDLHIPGSHSPLTPIRPSLFGALEFRNVLQQLQDSRSTSTNAIPLQRRSQEINDQNNDYGLSRSLPSNSSSYLATRYQTEEGDIVGTIVTPTDPSSHQQVLPSNQVYNVYNTNNTSTLSLPAPKSQKLSLDSSNPLQNKNTTGSSQNVHDSLTHESSEHLRKALPKLQIPQLVVTDFNSEIHESTTISPPSFNINPKTPSLTNTSIITESPFSPSSRISPTSQFYQTSGNNSNSDTSIPANPTVPDVHEELASFDSNTHPDMIPSTPTNSRWISYLIPSIPSKYVPMLTTLFPSLVGLTTKSWITIFTSLSSAPAIFLLTITVPVIEAETLENEVSTPTFSPVKDSEIHSNSQQISRQQDPSSLDLNNSLLGRTTNNISSSEQVYRYRDDENEATDDNLISPNAPSSRTVNTDTENSFLLPMVLTSYVPINRSLLVVQSICGPLFVMITNMDDSNPWISTIIYSVLSSAVFLVLIRIFVPEPKSAPTYIHMVSLIGFVIAISWISVVANEVVGILKALGIMFHISDAILGLTVFAVGNSLGDLVANTTVAKMGFPMMALSACFGGPMLNILVGIGISGLLVMPANTASRPEGSGMFSLLAMDSAEYHVTISHSLIISGITLLATLVFLLVTIPLNQWKMSRTIGIISVSFWVISTVVNVIMDLLVFKQ